MRDKADIWLFNPTCDFAVGNGKPSWQPNKLLQKMEADMDVLPVFLAAPDDYIMVNNLPSEEFLCSFNQLNPDLPHFIQKKEAIEDLSFRTMPKNHLKPWGWSPAVHKLLSPLKENCSEDFKNSPVFNWLPAHRDLYSRKFALSVLTRMIEDYPNRLFINAEQVPRICGEKTDFEAALEDWGTLMIKAPWSSSGRGLQPITKTPVHPKVWEKVLGIVKDQGYAMVEPLLSKQLDIAFQFEITGGKVTFLGISNFTTDNKGQYTGNYLNGLPDSVDQQLKSFAGKLPGMLIDPLIQLLERSDLASLFEGNFGVDALIYKDQDGQLKVNPCLEINFRQNMGLLSLRLEKLLKTGTKAVFRTWFDPSKSFAAFKNEMEKQYPISLENGKIAAGFLALTDARDDSRFGAYLFAAV